jgi:cold shock CspA family protein
MQNLREGERVEFAVEETVRGLQATSVVRVN